MKLPGGRQLAFPNRLGHSSRSYLSVLGGFNSSSPQPELAAPHPSFFPAMGHPWPLGPGSPPLAPLAPFSSPKAKAKLQNPPLSFLWQKLWFVFPMHFNAHEAEEETEAQGHRTTKLGLGHTSKHL